MEQQQIMDELNYHRAQKITETLYRSGLISFDEYDKLTQKNRRSFSLRFTSTYCRKRLIYPRNRVNMDTAKGGDCLENS